MIYFTSDLHLFHDKDFIFKRRGFDSIAEMHEAIKSRWNSTVHCDDIVYICGDMMCGGDAFSLNSAITFLKELNGIKYLAIGNHDTDGRLAAFKEAEVFHEIAYAFRIKISKTKYFYITHYPTIVDNEGRIKVYNLFGHTHQETKWFDNKDNMYHVGMDAHNCCPVSIEKIREELKEKESYVK